MKRPPVFVMGTQRSGTTLLTRVLSAHKDMYVQNEIRVEGIFAGEPSKELVLARMKQAMSFTVDEDIETYLDKQGKAFWGVKDPEFTQYIPQLKAFLPESKFVIIVRDARGVANSYMENKWGLGTNTYTGAMRWLREVKAQKAFMAEYPDNFILIRFEDLVNDMPNTLQTICKHIGVEFDDNMLQYDKTKAAFWQNSHNENTNKSPDLKHAEKWRRALSENEIRYCESIAKEEMEACGYELLTDATPPNKLLQWYYKIHQTILGEIQLQLKLKGPSIRKKIDFVDKVEER